MNSSGVGRDVEEMVVKLALGQGGRDDRPAGPHVVHDLGWTTRPVEGMVDPVRDQADVEGAVVLVDQILRSPAQGVDVGPRQEPAGLVVPGRRPLADCASRPTTTIDAFGNAALRRVSSFQSTRSSSDPT